MKKLLVLLLALLLCVNACCAEAAEVRFTETCEARILARRALMDKYGLSQGVLGFFTETLYWTDGAYIVRYMVDYGEPNFDYVAGRYTVTVRDGKAEASWSWDGQSIRCEGFGLAAGAWGREQLEECLLINYQTASMQYLDIAARIAWANGFTGNGTDDPLPVDDLVDEHEMYPDYSGQDELEQIRLTEEEHKACETAIAAIRYSCGMDDVQAQRLSVNDENCSRMKTDKGERVFVASIVTGNADPLMTGQFTVYVNMDTGIIEALTFMHNNIGNG